MISNKVIDALNNAQSTSTKFNREQFNYYKSNAHEQLISKAVFDNIKEKEKCERTDLRFNKIRHRFI